MSSDNDYGSRMEFVKNHRNYDDTDNDNVDDNADDYRKKRKNDDYNRQYGGAIGNNMNRDEEFYKYKARKYHYKIQSTLKKMMSEGKAIPDGYHAYLNNFDEDN